MKSIAVGLEVRTSITLVEREGIRGKIMKCHGVIDTGADVTVISDKCAALMGLKPIGECKTGTGGGEQTAKLYVVDLRIGDVVYRDMEVKSLPLPDGEALIGMDIIGKCNLVMDNDRSGYHFYFAVPPSL